MNEINTVRIFITDEERIKLYGDSTAFIEFQYCKMPKNSKIKKILSVYRSKHRVNDSLYIYHDDLDLFLENYAEILNDAATYNNLEKGPFDMFGYNYYEPSQVTKIIDKIKKLAPINSDELLKWLEGSKNHNGFYVMGI